MRVNNWETLGNSSVLIEIYIFAYVAHAPHHVSQFLIPTPPTMDPKHLLALP